MKILITGATGLIGRQLGLKLVEQGHQIRAVSRDRQKALQNLPFPAEIIECDLLQSPLTQKDFAGVDAIVHLLGETVDGRWSDKKKKEIMDSRVLSSVNLLKNCPADIKTIVTTSAQGFYGDRGDEILTEDSLPGEGFLADVCQQWEKPFTEFQNKYSTRVVIVRIGVVLSREGGALKKLVSLFQKNLGASLGSGKQWMSWISLDDVSEIFLQAVLQKSFKGVINAAHPEPVQNQEFTELLCQKLGTLQLPSVPGFVLKTMLGEMSEIVLGSYRVDCQKLKNLEFQFKSKNLKEFFDQELECFKNGQGFFYAQQFIPADIEKVFQFFSDAMNLEKLTPSLLNFKVEKLSTPEIQKDTLIDYKLKIHGVPVHWRTLIETWDPPYKFTDQQLKGPYTLWHHTHTFKKLAGGTLMIDEVLFKLPLGLLGRLTAGSFVESDVGQIFGFRRQVIAEEKF